MIDLNELFEGLLRANNVTNMDEVSKRNAKAFFYSGCALMFDQLHKAADDLSDEEGQAMMESLYNQFKEFFNHAQTEN